MDKNISILKGIHPGIVLGRELKKRNLSQRHFALSINEFPQTIGAIIKGKRDINAALSIKLEQALDLDEGYFMVLQAYHDVKQAKLHLQEKKHPRFSMIRPAIFWDTSIDKIDWGRQKRSVVKRIFERGNEREKKEITRFYGIQVIETIMGQSISR